MSSRGKITRRNLIQRLIFFGVAGSVIPGRALAAWIRSDSTGYLAMKLAGILKNKRSARIIGHEYLEMVPREASKQRLVALICDTEERYSSMLGEGNESLRKLVLEQQRADFANGRTIKLKGWILSQTEARLYALTAILG